jgi:23S rRNA pseudouridine2605 synthase
MEERLQKILARAGLGSRRACEELIVKGRVRVNQHVAIIGEKADATKDEILLDGKHLPKVESKFTYIALYKPQNVLSDVNTSDPRPTVRDLVPIKGKLFLIGRLDYESEGLIILTNDGEVTNILTHPRYEHEKEYRVKVGRTPDEEQLEIWRRGVVLEDGTRTAPAKVVVEGEVGKYIWLRVIMHEGRKRQIREIGARIGLPVLRILRTRIGPVQLGKLKPREWRFLTFKEIQQLQDLKKMA